MPESNQEIDFLTAKDTLIRELSKNPLVQEGKVSIPLLIREQNETKLEFSSNYILKENFFLILNVISSQIPNLRVHAIDRNYISLQALNENIYEPKNLHHNIKFRFFFEATKGKVEINKQGNLKENEILAIIQLFHFLVSNKEEKKINPKEVLSYMGAEVFDPTEAKLKGRWMDFTMVYGYEGVKKQIQESIIMPLKHPNLFQEIHSLTRKNPESLKPRAVLFEGEPGVGKTTMARVIACQCDTIMVYVPIESIMSKYYGESAKNLSFIFDACELFPKAIIFLDEIDSLAGKREDGMFEATRTILSVLLRKLDGFSGKPGTITIGATNRKMDLDKALLSRFDRSIYFPLPNTEEVTEILQGYAMHLNKEERTKIAEKLGSISGRKIKDFCDFVERKWATYLIENQKPIEPPPAELYLESAEFLKKNSNE